MEHLILGEGKVFLIRMNFVKKSEIISNLNITLTLMVMARPERWKLFELKPAFGSSFFPSRCFLRKSLDFNKLAGTENAGSRLCSPKKPLSVLSRHFAKGRVAPRETLRKENPTRWKERIGLHKMDGAGSLAWAVGEMSGAEAEPCLDGSLTDASDFGSFPEQEIQA